MEKRLMLLAKLLKKKFKTNRITFEVFNYSNNTISIQYEAYNGENFIQGSTIPQLIEKLHLVGWINKDDLIPKTRTKKEITTTNKGKFNE